MKQLIRSSAAVLALAMSLQIALYAQGPAARVQPLDAGTRAEVIDGIIRLLHENYVFPETAKRMEQALRERVARKEYDAVADPAAFARLLTDQLLEVCKDKHLRVIYRPEGLPRRDASGEPSAEEQARVRAQMAARNFGFEKLERLNGNIGYIDLRGFMDAAFAGETVAAAISFLANTDALIFDLRQNGGGDPAMVALISSYLFDQRTHLNDLYDRPRNKTEEFWTRTDVPGRRFGGEKPVYILTSRRTFSAAEEFTYNLKNLKRATIIGETTGGGAHPVQMQRINDHFGIGVPFARAINPITKTNWEGTGVAPDLAVPADQALRVAQVEALRAILPKVADTERATSIKSLLGSLQQEAAPAAAPQATQTPAFELPKTPAGKVFGEFLQAFNTGKLDVLKKFHRDHGGSEENAEQDLNAFQQLGELVPQRVEDASDTQIGVRVQTKKSGQTLIFRIGVEAAPPHGITDVRIQPAGAPAERTSARPKDANPSRDAGALVDQQAAEDRFSGVVVVAKNGQPVFEKAVGFADKSTRTPNRIDTKFNLGSINKVFTKIAILQLVEAGKLSLDDTIGKHLPAYPNRQAAEKATIRHLVNMQSGIGDFFGPKFDATPKEKIRSIQDYFPLFAAEPLKFEPGTSNSYSNGGYIVLGAIIEKVTGQSYYDYVRERIFAPAGMKETESYLADANTPNMAEGYRKNEAGERVLNRDTRPARGSSAGGGYSTAGDLLRFSQALQAGKLLDAAHTRQLIGGGIGVAGGAPGINAVLEIDPPTGYTVVVLSNYDPPSATDLGQRIREMLGM